MKVRGQFIVALVLSVWFAIYGGVWAKPLFAQQTLIVPAVYKASTGIIGWTTGTVNNGGHAVSITAGTASLGASKTDCSSPSYAACDFLISNSGGTVSVVTLTASVVASGVTLLAIIETDSSSNPTNIVNPNQVSTGKVFGQ